MYSRIPLRSLSSSGNMEEGVEPEVPRLPNNKPRYFSVTFFIHSAQRKRGNPTRITLEHTSKFVQQTSKWRIVSRTLGGYCVGSRLACVA